MSARSRVTITLGHTGQVVKRDAANEEGSRRVEPQGSYAYGGKRRTVKDRLGDDIHVDNKRQRRDKWTSGTNMYDGGQSTSNCQTEQDDLRLKLMRKNLSRQMKEKEQIQKSFYNECSTTHQLDDRKVVPLSKPSNHVRRIPHERNAGDVPHMRPIRKSYSSWDISGVRQRSPHERSAEDVSHMEPIRKSYFSWDINGVRQRSPDRVINASRGFSSVPSVRSIEPSSPYVAKNIIEQSVPVSYMAKDPDSPINIQGPKPIVHLPPPGSGVPKSTFMFDENITVGRLLNALGLRKYAILFQAEEVDMAALKQMSDGDLKDLGIPMVDMAALKQMSDGDLKDLGIPMGPRKKILLAVAPRPKQRPV